MSRLCYFCTMYDRDSHSVSLYGNERLGHSAENLLLCSTQERNYPFNQGLIWPYLTSEINAKMMWDVRPVSLNICLLFFRVRELRKAREHESVQKSPLTLWHYSPDSSFQFFCFNQRRFTRGKKNSKNTATLTTTLCLILLKQLHFFISLYSFYVYFMKERANCCGSKTLRTLF